MKAAFQSKARARQLPFGRNTKGLTVKCGPKRQFTAVSRWVS
jgi:hypothetical protein